MAEQLKFFLSIRPIRPIKETKKKRSGSSRLDHGRGLSPSRPKINSFRPRLFSTPKRTVLTFPMLSLIQPTPAQIAIFKLSLSLSDSPISIGHGFQSRQREKVSNFSFPTLTHTHTHTLTLYECVHLFQAGIPLISGQKLQTTKTQKSKINPRLMQFTEG